MAIALKSVDALQEHLRGVLEHADRHAGGVNEVLLAVIGGVLWRKNPGEPVRVGDKNGAGGNIIWFRIGAQRYALLYKYKAGRIELMLDSRHGHVLHAFTNATPLAEVVRVFSTLGLSDEAGQAQPAEPSCEVKPPVLAEAEPAESARAAAQAAVKSTEVVGEPLAPAADGAATPTKVTRKAKKPADKAERAAPATKTARKRSKADTSPLPEAGELPLVNVADAAPKPATTRKRRATAKASTDATERAASVAETPPEASAAEAKPRAKSRSKSTPPALQPA